MFSKLFIRFLLFQSFSFVLILSEQKRFNGYTVYRIRPQTVQQLNYLKELSENELELDFWTYPSMINRTVDVMIGPELKPKFQTFFRQKSLTFEPMIEDLEKLLEEQRMEEKRTRDEAIPGFWDRYQTLENVWAFVDAIVSQNPSIASQEVIGQSYEKRNLVLLKLGINSNSNKPIIFIDSTIHAREWITTATTTYFIQQLVDGVKANNANITALLTKYDYYFVPVLNPDGYVYSHTSDRMWRKTRRPNSGSTCIGTDANRNFNFQWNTVGSSTNPCSETYAGNAAFSEPETKALSDYILGIKNRVKLYIAMHSYSQLLLTPWGYTTAFPPNRADYVVKSNIFKDAIKAAYGTTYTAGTSTEVLYASSGGARDWVYAVGEISFSFTIELRDTGTYGFQLPVSQIKPSGIETTQAILALSQSI